jgi:hypothetical protein
VGSRVRAWLVVVVLTVTAAVVASYVAVDVGDGSAQARGHQPVLRLAGETASFPDAFRNRVLVWTPGGFSPREVAHVRDSTWVAAISAVRLGQLGVASAVPGYQAVPVEAISADGAAYAAALGAPGAPLAGMLRYGVVLSHTGAALRHVRAGGRLRLANGRMLPVAGVVDDVLLGGYELLVDRTLGQQLQLNHVEYLLVRPRGQRPAFEAALRNLLPRRQLAFHVYGDRPWLRAGEQVLPLAQLKARFGEFAVKSLAHPLPDPRWVARNIVTRQVPLLGTVHCHRRIIGDLAAAMAELRRDHLEALVDSADFRRHGRCYLAHPQAGPGEWVSRSTWGVAIQLNVSANPPGQRPRPDRRLADVMARHGFAWGGDWVHPAGASFEWVGTGG